MPETETARKDGGAEAPRGMQDAARPEGGQPLARLALAQRKRRDAAAVLPLAAILLFCSPVIDLFAGAGRLVGIPVGVVFLFTAWFALIAIAAGLARRLVEDSGDG
jgi:hypothetical protein